MGTLSSLFAAVAAVVAAVLAAVNLYVSTRQERVRWLRDSLLDTYQSFLGASFDWGDAAKGAYGGSPTLSDLDERLPAVRQRVGQAHSEQVQALTRLRLLADADVVRVAESVHERNHTLSDLVVGVAAPPSEQDWRAPAMSLRSAQEHMIDTARRSMDLEGGSHTGPPP